MLTNFDINRIRGALRQAFIRSDYRKEFVKLHRIECKVKGRKRVFYPCNECNDRFSSKDINVDHIRDIGSFKCLTEIEHFAYSLYCSYDNLQILCKCCHKKKTARERRLTALARKL